jgi:hypothetical protein
MSQQQFSFPVLQDEELLPCLEEMEIPISAAQLAKPTYEVIAPIFENILINLTGITRCVAALSGGAQAAKKRAAMRTRAHAARERVVVVC